MQSVQKLFSFLRPAIENSSCKLVASCCLVGLTMFLSGGQCGGCVGFISHFWDQELCGNCKHNINTHYWKPSKRTTEGGCIYDWLYEQGANYASENTYNVVLFNDDIHSFEMVVSYT